MGTLSVYVDFGQYWTFNEIQLYEIKLFDVQFVHFSVHVQLIGFMTIHYTCYIFPRVGQHTNLSLNINILSLTNAHVK